MALKVILDGAYAGPDALARFRREASAAAGLQHPNIVQVYEIAEHDGRPYFSLEFVAGGSLAARLTSGPLPAGRAAELVETLARAVHAAHQQGVIHRDLKPANILLTPDGTPKVTDFGLAKRAAAACASGDTLPGGEGEAGSPVSAYRTQNGAVLGTPSYMSPEQARGQGDVVGPPTDVYGLGAVLYEALTGRPPFRAATPFETLQQVLAVDPVPPRQLQPGVPRDLETVCLKCLHKEPARRYASAAELADDLHRFLRHEPIRARPIGRVGRSVRWARRRPAAAALLAVSLLALLALAGDTAWFTTRLERALAQRTGELRAEQRAREEEARDRQYLADMRLAYQSWKDAEAQPGQELLPRLRPTAGEKDRRGFAWQYLWRQCDRLRSTLPAHAGGILCLAAAPDGTVLASGGANAAIKLWDTATWQVRATLTGHAGAVRGLAFSADGATLASGGADGTVRLWDVARGRQRATLLGMGASVRALALSGDGRWLAASGVDGQDRLWDLTTSASPTILDCPPNRATPSLAFTPDGRTLASGGWDGMVRLWNPALGQEVGALQGHGGKIRLPSR